MESKEREAQVKLLTESPDLKAKAVRNKNVYNVLVLDSAHSWLICFANFITMIFGSSVGRAINMTFLSFVEDFQVTITQASIGFTLQLVFFSLSTMFMTALVVPKYGERITCTAGSLVGSLSTLGIAWSPNIQWFLFFMTLKGVSTGSTSVASISLINKYFDKWKSLATSVACSGLALGSMGAPPLVKLLIETYGRRGVFLIIGALEMNNIGMSMLLRPTSRYSSVVKSDEIMNIELQRIKIEEDNAAGDNKCTENQSDKELVNDNTLEKNEHPCPNSSIVNGGDLIQEHESPLLEIIKANGMKPEAAETDTKESESFQESHNQFSNNCKGSHDILRSISVVLGSQVLDNAASLTEKEPLYLNHNQTPDNFNSSQIVSRSISGDKSIKDLSPEILPRKSFQQSNSNVSFIFERLNSCDVSAHLKRSNLGSRTSKVNVSSTWSVISTPVSDVLVGQDVFTLQDVDDPAQGDQSKNCMMRFLNWFHGAFNIHLFRTWSLRCLLLYNMTGVLVLYLSTYFPTIGAKAGLRTEDIALMLIVCGGVDFASRLAIGAFSDLKMLSTTQIVGIAQLIVGTACHFTYFYTSFEALMALAVIIGLFGGTRQSMGTLVCLQFMGAEQYIQALGFQTMTATLSMAIHHPLLSSILEMSGSFNPPLHYVGVAAYLSATILFLEPLTKRLDAKKLLIKNKI